MDGRFVNHEADICVIGGGMSGMLAAVSAARRGLKVVLMHDRPVFGGNASSEIRMWIRGASLFYPELKEGGILEELALENIYYNPQMDYPMWDAVLYNKIMSQKTILPILNCSCNNAKVTDGRIEFVEGWQLNTYQTHRVSAKCFIDCSGDSILSYLTAAGFMTGREDKSDYNESLAQTSRDAKTMGNSVLFQARETPEAQKYTPPPFAREFAREDFNHRLALGGKKFLDTNYWWIETGGEENVVDDGDRIRAKLLSAAYGVWDYVKNSGAYDSANWTLDFMGYLPGKRESRRYKGGYVLNQNDIETGRVFEDEIAYGGWWMDDHDPRGMNTREEPNKFHFKTGAYSIPLRSICSENIENLMFAGRNISASHLAVSSTRVMATCAMLGQAAGTAAYFAVKNKCGNSGLQRHAADIKQALRVDDCYLLGTPYKISDALKNSGINLDEGEAAALKSGIERKLDNKNKPAALVPGRALEILFDKSYNAGCVRLVFDSDLPRDCYPDSYENEKMFPARCHLPLKGNKVFMPPSLIKSFEVFVRNRTGEWQSICREENNIRRLVKLEVSGGISGIRIMPLETWGNETAGIFSADIC